MNASSALIGGEREADLDKITANGARRDVLRDAEREALGELAGTNNGAGLDALATEIAGLSGVIPESLTERTLSRLVRYSL